MNRVNYSLDIITLTLVLVMSLAAMGSAFAKSPIEPNWLWPDKSIPVAQSTKALMMGRDERAISHAERALDKVRDYDRVVALQNLCLGWLRLQNAERATAYCESAITAARVLAPSRAKTGYSTLDVVKANIQLTRDAYSAQVATVTDAAGH